MWWIRGGSWFQEVLSVAFPIKTLGAVRILWSLLLVAGSAWIKPRRPFASSGRCYGGPAQVGAAMNPTSVVDSYGRSHRLAANKRATRGDTHLVGIGFSQHGHPRAGTRSCTGPVQPRCEIGVLLELGANLLSGTCWRTARGLPARPTPLHDGKMLTYWGQCSSGACRTPVAPAPLGAHRNRSCCRYCRPSACGSVYRGPTRVAGSRVRLQPVVQWTRSWGGSRGVRGSTSAGCNQRR